MAYGNSRIAVLEIENNAISVEIARTIKEHRLGLMYRESLGQYDGMLFIYEKEDIVCMWMKNTFIPLTVLFIDDKGHVLEMADMIPQTETPHCSSQKVKYALEVQTKWLKSTTIGLRSQITNLNTAGD